MKLAQKLRVFRYVRLGRLIVDFSTDDKQVPNSKKLEFLIARAVAATLVCEGINRRVYVSVNLTTPDRIRELNRTYRSKDVETDVLSFPLWERDEWSNTEPMELGDIVISYQRAVVQAKELGQDVWREIAFLTVHSTLHLLGYDHERSREEDIDVCRRQNNVMDLLSFKDNRKESA